MACLCSELVCRLLSVCKGTSGHGLSDRSRPRRLILIPACSSSQCGAPRGGTGKPPPARARGSTRRPRRPPRPQSPGRRAGRKGKHRRPQIHARAPGCPPSASCAHRRLWKLSPEQPVCRSGAAESGCSRAEDVISITVPVSLWCCHLSHL